MAKPKKFYWDTCAFIGLLNGEAEKKRELQIVYGWAREGKAEIWTSTLAMIECRRLDGESVKQKPMSEKNGKKISDIFRQQWTCHTFVPLRLLTYAAFASKAKGLFQPRAECLRRGL